MNSLVLLYVVVFTSVGPAYQAPKPEPTLEICKLEAADTKANAPKQIKGTDGKVIQIFDVQTDCHVFNQSIEVRN